MRPQPEWAREFLEYFDDLDPGLILDWAQDEALAARQVEVEVAPDALAEAALHARTGAFWRRRQENRSPSRTAGKPIAFGTLTSGLSASSGHVWGLRARTGRDRIMQRSHVSAVMVILGLVLVGCGGGGGDSKGAATETPTPDSMMRRISVGDSWNYVVVGTYHPNDGSPAVSQSGTIKDTIFSAQIGTTQCLADVTSVTLTDTYGTKTTTTLTTYFVQDPATGQRTILGSKEADGSIRVLTSPVHLEPAVWQAGASVLAEMRYANGDTETRSRTVDRAEWVDTPAGRIAAWHGSGTTSADGATMTGTFWAAPQLGCDAKFVQTESYAGGGTVDLAITLQSYSLH